MMNAYKAYMETEVNTASNGRLVLMLFNGTMRFINEARVAIEQRQIETAHNKIMRTIDIVEELRMSLDLSAGELAQNLDRLYEYVIHKLVQANVQKDLKDLDDAQRVISDIRDAWTQIVAGPTPDR